MVKRALCDCGGVVPRTGRGSAVGLCPRCFKARRAKQLVVANRDYRLNHGLVGYPAKGLVSNLIGMQVRRRTSGGVSHSRRYKHPRYL